MPESVILHQPFMYKTDKINATNGKGISNRETEKEREAFYSETTLALPS